MVWGIKRGEGALGNFKEYVEWVLLHNGSPFTIYKEQGGEQSISHYHKLSNTANHV